MNRPLAGPADPVGSPGPVRERQSEPGRYRKALLPVSVWLLLFLVPTPTGLTNSAWSYFALFAGVIVALILEPIPAAAVGLIGVALTATLRYVEPTPAGSVAWAVSGFSNSTVWLIFGAYVFSIGYGKTGLGRRIALHLVKALGSRTLGLGYAITLSDLALAPGTPSNTARSAGIVFPVISNLPSLYGSEPGRSARRIGSYLMWTAFATTAVTSSMFLTALAPNALAVSIVKNVTGIEISWTSWFLGFLPIGALLLLLVPSLCYLIYPPEIRSSREVPVWAAGELEKMSSFSRPELKMAFLVLLAILLWITGHNSQISLPVVGSNFIDPTGVVLLVVACMILTGVVTWHEIIGHSGAWNILVWFATLVALADGLNRVGFIGWLAEQATGPLARLDPILAMMLLVTFFFFIHYFFASLSAHTAAVLPVVLAVGAGIPGLPVRTLALLLVYSLGLMGVISPYATGPAPIYYASGFIARADFWRLGLIFGLIFLAALLAVGTPSLL
jgi:anion transporter